LARHHPVINRLAQHHLVFVPTDIFVRYSRTDNLSHGISSRDSTSTP